MPSLRTTTGFLAVTMLAALGAALVFLPGWLLEQYDRVAKLGPNWVYAYFAVVGTGAAIFLGSTGWIVWRVVANSRRRRERLDRRAKNPSELSAADRQREIEQNLAGVSDLQSDPAVAAEVREQLAPLVDRFEEKRESQSLEIVAFGTISSGKSSLLNALAGQDLFSTDVKGGTTTRRHEIPFPQLDRVTLVDTPGLGEVDGAEHSFVAAAAAKDADIVLLVVDGPLRDAEFELLRQLGQMEKRILVCLNKQDWYDECDRESLLGQLREQLASLVAADDVLSVQSQPAPRRRMRVLINGDEVEELIETPLDIAALAERMAAVVTRDGRDLLLANLLLQSRGLANEARRRVAESLDRRAGEIVDKYMWAAGGAAALSPTPVLDLIAGGAITTKMVVDLARNYRQEMELNAATQLLGQMGKQLIAVLGVSAATPAVVAAVGSAIKTVPGLGTVAGGLLQGVTQALVTKWIGAVFIDYFNSAAKQSPAGLAELAREHWQRLTTIDELRKLLTAARQKLSRPL